MVAPVTPAGRAHKESVVYSRVPQTLRTGIALGSGGGGTLDDGVVGGEPGGVDVVLFSE